MYREISQNLKYLGENVKRIKTARRCHNIPIRMTKSQQ